MTIEENRLRNITKFSDGSGNEITGEQKEAIIQRELAQKQEELDINLGTTEENRKIKEAADATFMKNQMELLTREDYVPSQIIDEEQVEADALGITKAELQERYDDDVDEFSDSEIAKMRYATDRADGDRIKDAADRAQEERDKETADAHSVNMANNAVQQVNVSNNRKVVSDPAPHNPDPTGSRLSVVPA